MFVAIWDCLGLFIFHCENLWRSNTIHLIIQLMQDASTDLPTEARIFAFVIRQAVDDFQSCSHWKRIKCVKHKRKLKLRYIHAKWWLFDPGGLERVVAQCKVSDLVSVEQIRRLAVKTNIKQIHAR